MAYTRLGLKDGEKVYATHISHVEDGIVQNENDITEVKDSLTELDDSLNGFTIYTNSNVSDLNDVLWGMGLTNTAENMPTDGQWHGFISLTPSSTTGIQVAYRLNTTNVYKRYKASGSWSAWSTLH